MNYRKQLYEYYVSRHTSLMYDISIETLEKECITYKRYFKRFLPRDKSMKILDIGCGYGGFLYFLNKEGYKNVIGVDHSQEQIDIARELNIKNVFRGNIIETLKKYTREFDVITALDIIEHFTKEEMFLLFDALTNALKPNGIFIMKSPNADGPFGSRFRYWDFTHEIAFTQTSIRQLLLIFDFKKIEVYSAGPVIHGIMSFVRYIIWQFFRYIIIFYLALETGCFKGYILTQNLIVVGRR